MSDRTKAAIVQAQPAFLDLAGSIAKAVDWIERAAREGAELVVFGETWLAGYPVWVDAAPDAARWDHGPARALYRRLVEQSPRLDGPEVTAIAEAASARACDVVMGLNERRGGSLFNTLLMLGRDGHSRCVHRKLVPTYGERLVWGRGDGSTLGTLSTPAGELGGLICWEHWMPLARAAMHARGERIHVAQWPTVHDLHQVASRHYAFEGGCFVLAAGSVLTKGAALESYRALGADDGLELLESMPGDHDASLLDGGSMIVGPDSKVIAGPVFGEETLIIADLDLGQTHEARLTLDADGHYSRPDIFHLEVDVTPHTGVEFVREPEDEPTQGEG